MGKTAFLFSGQGAQAVGMGRDLYEGGGAARAAFDAADTALGYPVSALCLQGPKEKLDQTMYTQPCVLAVDIAAARALAERGIRPDGVAGFSLGEFAALAVAGAMGDGTAFSLIGKRAAYMRDCCQEHPGGMAAVIGGEPDALEALCREAGGVLPVNYNCPGQTVVAGDTQALERFLALAAERKLRAMKLPVSGAFHTPLMAGASDKLSADLALTDLRAPAIPVYGNTHAAPYPTDAAAMRALMASQLQKPVRWEETIRAMARDGFDTFIECGPGNTLTGFFKRMKLDVGASVYSAHLV